ncbi:MAG TPA: phosphoserine phosphatase SerB [Rhodobacteraceae bacterium]|jgi:phosphoserine phosphatase|nr:phosphoserine phosphatase SerB [Paracoccaceae bacterium]HBG98777.1 phosphoserine phosphatase SerB [Paracoccaceae bacterium]
MFTTVLIGPPGGLAEDGVEALRRALSGTATRWLAPGRAAEFDHAEPGHGAAARAALAAAGCDVATLPAANRRKRLLIADMDSTVIGQECIDELAAVAGIGPQVARVTARAMAGELDFAEALRARVALLAGLPESAIARVIADRIRPTPGAATLVATMRAHGAHTALVSGGFTAFTAHIAGALGFDEHRANRLIVADGRLTGQVAEPVLGRDAKRAALDAIAARLGIGAEDVLAVGDGANDLAMIEAAGLGVAFHAKPALAARADARIVHGDLTALLYLQGYRRAEFAIG